MDPNLHALTRAVVDERPEIADPGVMADAVFARLDPRDYADAVRTMLRGYVREVMKEGRVLPRQTVPVPETAQPRPGSAFVRAIQSGVWKQRLGESYHTADGWKFLGECGRDDLLFIAAERRDLAEANLEAAQRAEVLANLLESHGVQKVGELPEAALEPVLT